MSAAAARALPPEMTGDGPEIIVRPMYLPGRAIDDFLADGLRRGWSERTLATYRRILLEFDDRLPVDADVTDIRIQDVRRYLGSKRGRARGTIAHAESVLGSWFKWMYLNGKIKQNPMARLERTKRIPASELDVVTVSTADVGRLLGAAEVLDALAGPTCWTYRLCLGILVYMGPRRRAVAYLRFRDYDPRGKRMRFHEKGSKTIWKPVPDALQKWIDGAIKDGQLKAGTDLLVPPEPGAVYSEDVLAGRDERDDRAIWRIVKDIGARAGMEVTVHAMRRVFAVTYLEQNPGDIEGLKELMGHRSIATTERYLQELNKEKAMGRVRSLTYA